MPVQPTGARHEVGIDDMFFSTTDGKGIIEQANNVFVRLAHYTWDELHGAPHNIIRHPIMPGAAFKAMWDALEQGKPFTAYVHNLAGNGSQYDVFASITPLDDGYLSVRIRPTCTELFDTVDQVYQAVHSYEEELKASGMNRHNAAAAGVEKIGEMLGTLGMSSYHDLECVCLPAEIARREKLGFRLPSRPLATGPLKTMLDDATSLYHGLEDLMARQDTLTSLSDSLAKASSDLIAAIGQSGQITASLMAHTITDSRLAALMMPLTLWSSMEDELHPHLNALAQGLSQLDRLTAETKFRVALARLHTSMVARFVSEMIDGDTASDSIEAIVMLCRAVKVGLDDMSLTMREHADLTRTMISHIDEAADVLMIPRDLIQAWHCGSNTGSLPETIRELVPQVMSCVDSSATLMDQLSQLAGQCRRSASEIFDLRDLYRLTDQIIATVGSYAGSTLTIPQLSADALRAALPQQNMSYQASRSASMTVRPPMRAL